MHLFKKKLAIILASTIALATIAAKKNHGQGNVYYCNLATQTCRLSSTLTTVNTGTTAHVELDEYFTGPGAGSCNSLTRGCNNVHPTNLFVTEP